MQMSLFEVNEEEKLHEIFIEDLKVGSGFEDGKKRIVDFFNQNLTKPKTIKLLKDEYGIGGRSTIASGGYNQDHNANGIKITLATREEKQYTWDQVYDEIFNLIGTDEYSERVD